MKLLAIDPASITSGIASFKDGVLVDTMSIKTNEKEPKLRRSLMANQLHHHMCMYDVIVSEEPAIQGRGGVGMNRLLGMIEFITGGQVYFIHPMTVKSKMGHGSKDKLEVALAAGLLLKTKAEQDIMAALIAKEAWDETDAVAIGLTYFIKERLI